MFDSLATKETENGPTTMRCDALQCALHLKHEIIKMAKTE